MSTDAADAADAAPGQIKKLKMSVLKMNALGSGVAQLTARSLTILEDPGSNPTIGNFYWTNILLTIYRKDEN